MAVAAGLGIRTLGHGAVLGDWEIDRFAAPVDENTTAGIREDVDPIVAEAERKAAQEEIDKEVKEQRAVRAERSERFYKDYRAWIVAGPLRVPPAEDGPDEDQLVVAVARARLPSDLMPAPECVVYEINSSGWINGLASVPRVVIPHAHLGLRGASIWTLEGGAIARLGTADTSDIR